jgi:hypothetical protein
MNMDRDGKVYPPYKVRPDKALAEQFLIGQGASVDLSTVPPTYMIFLRGERWGVNLFDDLSIPHEKALHGGQRYEWLAPIDWDDELEVTARVESIVEKQGRGGKIWFANVAFDYTRADGTPVLREITRLIERE